jgi:hypothetical protein
MAEATLALSMAPLGGGLKTERLDVERLEQHEAVLTDDAERSREFARNGPPCPATSWKCATRTAPSCPSAASAASTPAAPA